MEPARLAIMRLTLTKCMLLGDVVSRRNGCKGEEEEQSDFTPVIYELAR